MREPPVNLADDTLRACLRSRHGLAVTELTFLPLGHDASAWVYRVRTADNRAYFLKVRTRITNVAGLLIPHHLHDRGIARVVAPLPTTTAALWTAAGEYAAILYPFITGETGMERGMSTQQWSDYGALLRQIHDTALTADLVQIVGRDAFTPDGADMVMRLDAYIGARSFDDPAARQLATFWQMRRGAIHALLDCAEDLGRRLSEAGRRLSCATRRSTRPTRCWIPTGRCGSSTGTRRSWRRASAT